MFWDGVDVQIGSSNAHSELSILKTLGVKFRISPTRVKLAVIGGGIAGLVAGLEARRLGFDVTILEGRSHRVGGRIHTVNYLASGLWAESGPEFISPSHHFLKWYIERYKLSLLKTEGMEDSPFTPILDCDGIDHERIRYQSNCLKELLIKEANGLSSCPSIYCDEMKSFDSDSLWKFIEKTTKDPITRRYLETHFEFENGINPRKIGLLPYLLLVKGHGEGFFENLELYRLNGGLSQLTNSIKHNVCDLVSSNSLVKRITHERKFSIQVASGKRTEVLSDKFDSIILTVPPRLWEHGELFDMHLPSSLVPQMGDSIKVMIKVPIDIKIETGILPSSFLAMNTLVQAIWESGIGTNTGARILTVMCGGGAAEQLARMTQAEAIDALKREIGIYIPRLTNIDNRNFHFKDWGKRKLTRCGYGCPAPHELTYFRPQLESLLPNNLHVCGDWNSWEMWGYMEGAIRSALTTVLKICRDYGAEIPKSLTERMV